MWPGCKSGRPDRFAARPEGKPGLGGHGKTKKLSRCKCAKQSVLVPRSAGIGEGIGKSSGAGRGGCGQRGITTSSLGASFGLPPGGRLPGMRPGGFIPGNRPLRLPSTGRSEPWPGPTGTRWGGAKALAARACRGEGAGVTARTARWAWAQQGRRGRRGPDRAVRPACLCGLPGAAKEVPVR